MKKLIILAVLLGVSTVSAQKVRVANTENTIESSVDCDYYTVEGHWEWIQNGVIFYPVWVSTYTYKVCRD